MKKITFPHMGSSHIAFSMLVKELGHEVIKPPAPTRKTLTYGTKHSPEFACIPFKVLLGTYLEAIEKGADTIVSSGGVGPCRAGYYGELQNKILQDIGYNPDFVIFEPPLKSLSDFMSKIKILKGNNSWIALLDIVRRTWHKLIALDDLESEVNKIRPYELNKGETSKQLKIGQSMLDEAQSMKEIKEARNEALKAIRKVKCLERPEKPIKVGLIGEIYVVLEPFINADVEKTLGELGVQVDRSIHLTNWTRDNTLIDGEKGVKKLARPYLDQLVGGHGQNSIGETIHYAENDFDGVVHLAPFTCIPEIVAKSIIPKVSQDYNIPVITLFLDEQTGKAGVQTRLEAFVDLIKKKRLGEVS
ncbi:2-hydroxyacyl-CoA dehydratase [Natranaerobius trueperi]|uniref:CoA protein activase n=1 Tax=Natranaerobius trueperi TaxID=759412 RepID=A0A226BYV0_9FIRM|nr:2-hydroxyacyl-CoA dehydratase [Natranaerobius trueperi]OWZ83287.1 CoA protein activase [Natranaerobius trueperi]